MKMTSYFFRTTIAASVLSLIGLSACKQNSALAPQPAKLVEGQYRAEYINLAGTPTLVGYPINGQTLSLQIKSVAADTVQVDIQAPPNGKYSPGQNLSYAKAYVASTGQSNGQTIYFVQLTNAADACGINTLVVQSATEIDYRFVPAGNQPCDGSRVRFIKR